MSDQLDLARKYHALIGSRDTWTRIINTLATSMVEGTGTDLFPKDFLQGVSDIVDSIADEVVEEMAQLSVSLYTLEELQSLVAFFGSPLGLKMRKLDTEKVGEALGEKYGRLMQARLRLRFEEWANA